MSAAVGSMSSTLGTIPFSVLSPGSADLSMAQRVALMPPSEQTRVLDGLDPEALIRDWSFWARPNQLPPEGKWNTWLCVAGRGFGKNRTASEWINQRVRDGHAKRVALLGRTAADVRDVIINGESGIIAVSRPGEVPIWEPSKRRLTWPNGAFALAFSADEPDQLRGPQFDSAVADEFASYPQITGTDGATAFDNLRLGLRLPVEGDMPRMILTTTPRRVPAMYAILEQAEDPDFGIVITRGTTYDNLANLADSFRSTILGLYEGTRLGQQELLGEMLQDIEGAMFSQSRFDDHRVTDLPVARMYGAVGVDPSVAERPKDECGIVVVKATRERDFYRRHLYTVEDASLLAPPSIWAKRVVQMSRKWGVPVVAEGNQGGELVRMAIGQVDSNVPVYIVHAKSGKATRAEPIAALTEQGRMHMVGWHSLLESQASSWVPAETKKSPDRVDAWTWAALSLVTKIKGINFNQTGSLRARSASAHRLPPMNAATLTRSAARR